MSFKTFPSFAQIKSKSMRVSPGDISVGDLLVESNFSDIYLIMDIGGFDAYTGIDGAYCPITVSQCKDGTSKVFIAHLIIEDLRKGLLIHYPHQ